MRATYTRTQGMRHLSVFKVPGLPGRRARVSAMPAARANAPAGLR
jgi:hypothetical protein